MTDLEITRLCAEAMGVTLLGKGTEAFGPSEHDGMLVTFPYNPLKIDAQAMALVKKFRVLVGTDGELWTAFIPWGGRSIRNLNLNRAICECVAKMQDAKAHA